MKNLHVAVDFGDDLVYAQSPYSRKNIEQMMEYFRRLGVNRVYWIYSHPWIDGVRPLDTEEDILKVAVECAHEYGMKLYGLVKPFETGTSTSFMPHTVRLPHCDEKYESISGFHLIIHPYILSHPEHCIQSRPQEQNDNPIQEIHLVNSDRNTIRIDKDDLKIWISKINGAFLPYQGEWKLTKTETKKNGSVITKLVLQGVSISSDYKYLLITCSRQNDPPSLHNDYSSMIELYDSDGAKIPHSSDQGIMYTDEETYPLSAFLDHVLVRRFGLYESHVPYLPEKAGEGVLNWSLEFGTGHNIGKRSLDGPSENKDGYRIHSHIAAVRGKRTRLLGLHPAYPEVRQYWLSIIEHCIQAGVDGVDIRVCNHSTHTLEPERFGFNDIIVREYKRRYGVDVLNEPYDETLWRELHGEYFTQYLRQARQLLRQHQLPLQIHVSPNMISGMDRDCWIRNNIPGNFEWPWRKWIDDDLLDAITLKNCTFTFGHPEERLAFAKNVQAYAKDRGKKVYWCSHNFKCDRERLEFRLTQHKDQLKEQIRMVKESPNLDGLILYEAAQMTRRDKNTGKVRGSSQIEQMINTLWK